MERALASEEIASIYKYIKAYDAVLPIRSLVVCMELYAYIYYKHDWATAGATGFQDCVLLVLLYIQVIFSSIRRALGKCLSAFKFRKTLTFRNN